MGEKAPSLPPRELQREILLHYVGIHLLSILELLQSDARLTGRLRLAAMPCCGRTAVIFLMNLNGLVAVTHFAEEERNFASNDD